MRLPGFARTALGRPSRDRVLVRRLPARLGGGRVLVSPDAAHRAGPAGAVLAAGPDPFVADMASRAAARRPAGDAPDEVLTAVVAGGVGTARVSVVPGGPVPRLEGDG